MRIGRLCCAGAAAALLCGLPARAQQAAAEAPASPVIPGTAAAILFDAEKAYNEKRYAEAIAAFEKFLRDFGASQEAQPALPRIRFKLAASQVQLQKFEAALDAIEAALAGKPESEAAREELSFWKGLALLMTGQDAQARTALMEFQRDFPRSPRVADAQFLAAWSHLREEKPAEAAKAFGVIRQSRSPHRGRAAVLQMHSLIQAGQDDEGRQLFLQEAPGQDQLVQLATFQALGLGLAEKALEADKPREAARILQFIWPREKLLERQKGQQQALQEQLERLERMPRPDAFQRAQLRQQLGDIATEIKNLEKLQSWDASARFRLASAFHDQDRQRESALLLDDMLREMPPDQVVESASMTTLQSWMFIERWDRAVQAAQVFAEKFPRSAKLPMVLYLQGVAQQKAGDYAASVQTFARLQKDFPQSDQAPRALFMQGFSQLLAEQNKEAAASFEQFLKTHPSHEMAENAAYWQASALVFDEQYAAARELLERHSTRFPQGSMAPAAAFRRAYAAYAMKDFPAAAVELQKWLKQYPEGAERGEAALLLGNALLDQGDAEAGKKAYDSVPKESGRFYDEAQFKKAKVLMLEEDYPAVRELMERFVAENSRNPRAAEALYIIGQSWRKEDRPDKAREAYWKAISGHGNDPAAQSIEELFTALNRLHKTPAERSEYLERLRSMQTAAKEAGQGPLELRSIWARAQAVTKTDPALREALLREATLLARPETTNPLILDDCATAQLSAGRPEKAAELYAALLKWHPRAPQKDRALATLARLARERGDEKAALDYYARLERDTPWSPLLGEALMDRAAMQQAAGDSTGAAASYNTVLAAQAVPGKVKAQALLQLGELEMAGGRPKTAIPYFQRIYIMYGRWRDAVARAYLRSGEAFEKLGDLPAARRTYEEMLGREDLSGLPEAAAARQRLEQLPETKS